MPIDRNRDLTATAQHNAASTDEPQRRYRSLDGVRGVAALVVLVHHSLLTIPALANPQLGSYHASGWAWWLTNTPVHTVWDGTEAVYVFFILSGFVLMPRLTRSFAGWIGYYGARLTRLYLPVFAATAFAAVMFLAVQRTSRSNASWWVNSHVMTLTPSGVVRDAILIRGTDDLNGPLWSLKWEVLFSVLLPLYVLFSQAGRRFATLKFLGLVALIGTGLLDGRSDITYLPMFALGSLVAVERDRLGVLFQRLSGRSSRSFWFGTLVVVVVALNAGWLVAARGPQSEHVKNTALLVELLGALGVVVLALYWPAAERLLEHRSAQWLGSRSFSLYLIHEPLVISVALLLGPRWAPLTIVIAVPVSLLAADAFYRGVERPTHRLSRVLGEMVTKAATSDLSRAGRHAHLVSGQRDLAPVVASDLRPVGPTKARHRRPGQTNKIDDAR